jgi:NitT/TauT family transport system ATP-binding protein
MERTMLDPINILAVSRVEKPNHKIEISARNIGLIYDIKNSGKKQPNKLTALTDVNIDVRTGEFLSIVGPSGCGKSTFLYILAGLIKRTSGAAYINNEEITGPSLNRGIIMQAYALFPWRTVQRNVEYGLEVKKLPKNERKSIADRFIALVGLSDFAQHYPYELSGGMKQRIAIARALAYDPDVLLMDEPFAAIDEQTKVNLHTELLQIWERTNKTIIFVTHNIDEAIFLSDRVAVMTPGPGTIKKVIDIKLPRPRIPDIKMTSAFGNCRNTLWQLLQDQATMTRETLTSNGRTVLEPLPNEAVI